MCHMTATCMSSLMYAKLLLMLPREESHELRDSPSGKDVSDVEVDDEREPGDHPQGWHYSYVGSQIIGILRDALLVHRPRKLGQELVIMIVPYDIDGTSALEHKAVHYHRGQYYNKTIFKNNCLKQLIL